MVHKMLSNDRTFHLLYDSAPPEFQYIVDRLRPLAARYVTEGPHVGLATARRTRRRKFRKQRGGSLSSEVMRLLNALALAFLLALLAGEAGSWVQRMSERAAAASAAVGSAAPELVGSLVGGLVVGAGRQVKHGVESVQEWFRPDLTAVPSELVNIVKAPANAEFLYSIKLAETEEAEEAKTQLSIDRLNDLERNSTALLDKFVSLTKLNLPLKVRAEFGLGIARETKSRCTARIAAIDDMTKSMKKGVDTLTSSLEIPEAAQLKGWMTDFEANLFSADVASIESSVKTLAGYKRFEEKSVVDFLSLARIANELRKFKTPCTRFAKIADEYQVIMSEDYDVSRVEFGTWRLFFDFIVESGSLEFATLRDWPDLENPDLVLFLTPTAPSAAAIAAGGNVRALPDSIFQPATMMSSSVGELQFKTPTVRPEPPTATPRPETTGDLIAARTVAAKAAATATPPAAEVAGAVPAAEVPAAEVAAPAPAPELRLIPYTNQDFPAIHVNENYEFNTDDLRGNLTAFMDARFGGTLASRQIRLDGGAFADPYAQLFELQALRRLKLVYASELDQRVDAYKLAASTKIGILVNKQIQAIERVRTLSPKEKNVAEAYLQFIASQNIEIEASDNPVLAAIATLAVKPDAPKEPRSTASAKIANIPFQKRDESSSSAASSGANFFSGKGNFFAVAADLLSKKPNWNQSGYDTFYATMSIGTVLIYLLQKCKSCVRDCVCGWQSRATPIQVQALGDQGQVQEQPQAQAPRPGRSGSLGPSRKLINAPPPSGAVASGGAGAVPLLLPPPAVAAPPPQPQVYTPAFAAGYGGAGYGGAGPVGYGGAGPVGYGGAGPVGYGGAGPVGYGGAGYGGAGYGGAGYGGAGYGGAGYGGAGYGGAGGAVHGGAGGGAARPPRSSFLSAGAETPYDRLLRRVVRERKGSAYLATMTGIAAADYQRLLNYLKDKRDTGSTPEEKEAGRIEFNNLSAAIRIKAETLPAFRTIVLSRKNRTYRKRKASRKDSRKTSRIL